MTVAGTGVPPEGGPSPIATPITHAVSAPEVVQYLQVASAPGAYDRLFHNWSTFVAFSLLISLCFGALCIYCTIRVFQIRQLERRKFAAAQRTVAAHDVPKTHLRWNRVFEQAKGDSAQGWRLGDAARLRQIAGNLISNGLKFTEAGEVRVAFAEGRLTDLEGRLYATATSTLLVFDR